MEIAHFRVVARLGPGTEFRHENEVRCSLATKSTKYKNKNSSFIEKYLNIVYCSVALCQNGNRNRPELSYFRFPADKQLAVWLKFCRRADSKFKEEQTKAIAGKEHNLRICSEHFTTDSYRKTLNGRRILNVSAIPTIFRVDDKSRTTSNERYEKLAEKRSLSNECHVKKIKKT